MSEAATQSPDVSRIATENFASLLGAELGRIHGGAISSLVDIAATAAFWSCSNLGPMPQGATVGFTINFLRLAVATDLTATATVRRRGGTLCTGDVSVHDAKGAEVAAAIVTYKLTGYRNG